MITPTTSSFNKETLQHSLQTVIETAKESWTYAIFWQPDTSNYSTHGSSILGWADGYYKGEYKEKEMVKNNPSSADEQAHRELNSLISGAQNSGPPDEADSTHGSSILGWADGYYKGEDKEKEMVKNNPSSADEQAHRKIVIRELNSLISGAQNSGSPDEAVDEQVTDTEWFFLVSMTQNFVNGSGLPGLAFMSNSMIWVSGAERLLGCECERARQAQVFGLKTLVCIPSDNGVLELGSTEVIYRSLNLMNKVRVLFDFNGAQSSFLAVGNDPEVNEFDPSALWNREPSPIVVAPSIVQVKDTPLDLPKYEDRQGIEYIRGTTRSRAVNMYPELQQKHGYEGQQGIEYIRGTTRSRSVNMYPELQQKHGYEGQQGIEYIQGTTRSRSVNMYPELQQKHGYEGQQGIEYIQGTRRSRSITMYPELQQKHGYEGQQGIKYIQGTTRSMSINMNHELQQKHGDGGQQGIEYIRGTTRSMSVNMNHELLQKHGNEGQQEMEYIQETTRSHNELQQVYEYEGRQGLEYVQGKTKSDALYPERKQRHGYEDRQEMEYIRETTKSDVTMYSEPEPGHRYEDRQGIEYIRETT